MIRRSATANWKGSGKEGNGTLSTKSTVLSQTQFSFNSRFAEGIGTNPEELVAAAHAGCFSMKLSFVLSGAGFVPDDISTECTISLDNGAITESHLEVKVTAPGLDAEQFAALAEEAKLNCPISKLLNTNITMNAVLV
ncbi:OsmC family peroxiredoxin [Sphingobacteriales bacterium UPWRP_1]|nr:OsmC family peroxiredoxin [Sphingobacteriales bacterium TSM_CSS]PSJ72033.1 OsmC family peroxiredoxin [Sphingobacteriales bacterium UPWRP_1]